MGPEDDKGVYPEVHQMVKNGVNVRAYPTHCLFWFFSIAFVQFHLISNGGQRIVLVFNKGIGAHKK